MLERNWPHFVPLAPFALACIHDHWCSLIVSQCEIIGTHQEDFPHHSRCWLQTVSLLIVTSLHCSALDHLFAPFHNLHFIPYSRRDASWVGISIWMLTLWPTIMLAPYPFHPAFFKWYWYKTIQAHYINQVSFQEIKTHSVQHWGKMPGPHSSLFMAYMHLTQDHWVDSTLALPWEWRSALEMRNHHHPYYAKPVPCQHRLKFSSIAPSGLMTMTLVIILFCCKVLPLHELGIILCWGTPPNLPTTPRIPNSNLCCHDQMGACLRRLDVAISYLLLLRSTCHDPFFMPHSFFFQWDNHNTSGPLTYLVLLIHWCFSIHAELFR